MQEPSAERSLKLWKKACGTIQSRSPIKCGVGRDAQVRGQKEENVQEGKAVHGLRRCKSEQREDRENTFELGQGQILTFCYL